jgi:hypothetical protein
MGELTTCRNHNDALLMRQDIACAERIFVPIDWWILEAGNLRAGKLRAGFCPKR